MTNHPNRRARPPGCTPKAGETPLPRQIRERREALGLTQRDAAALVHTGERTWQKWEGAERGMHPATWELFCIKTEALVATRRATAGSAA